MCWIYDTIYRESQIKMICQVRANNLKWFVCVGEPSLVYAVGELGSRCFYVLFCFVLLVVPTGSSTHISQDYFL